MTYEPLREYRFWAQGSEHNSDAPMSLGETLGTSIKAWIAWKPCSFFLKGVALLTRLHHKNKDGSETEIEDVDISVFWKETFLTYFTQ